MWSIICKFAIAAIIALFSYFFGLSQNDSDHSSLPQTTLVNDAVVVQSTVPTRAINHADKQVQDLQSLLTEARTEIAKMREALEHSEEELRIASERIEELRTRKHIKAFLKSKIHVPEGQEKNKHIREAKCALLHTFSQFEELFGDEEKAIEAWEWGGKCLRHGVGTPEDIADRFGAEIEAKIRKVVESAPYREKPRTHEQYKEHVNWWYENDLAQFRAFAPFYESGRKSSSTLTEEDIRNRESRERDAATFMFNQGGR